MKRMRWLIALLAVFSLFAAACGSDGDSSSDGGDTSADSSDSDDSGDSDDEEAMEDDEEAMEDEGGGDVVTDFGVVADEKVIRVGLNADLSGPFASLVSEIVAAQEVYWEVFNDNGGYQGWTVEPVVIDSGYATDVGIQNYETLAQESEEGVLMITENTGSPITAAIAPDAADDNMLVIPLSWASLWPDPDFGATILEKQATYCIESINGVEWMSTQVDGDPKLAILGRPGEYGEDGSAGAEIAAEELGIEIVYNGRGAVAGDDRTGVIAELVGSGANMVWTTLTPGETLDIFGNSVSQGFEAIWSGNSPSFNYLAMLTSDFASEFGEFYYQSQYQAPWGSAGTEEIIAAMTERRPELNISDVYVTGWIEGIMAETLIREAIDQGDMTRENMVAIATSGLEVDFMGLSGNQSWPNDYNEAVVRSTWIYDVVAEDFNIIPLGEYTEDNPGSTGMVPLEQDYIGTVAGSYQFDGPCITPSG